jgi:hypothetical protein
MFMRARPAIQTGVGFLSIRIKRPGFDDYKKLGKVMKYLQHVVDSKITLDDQDMSALK